MDDRSFVAAQDFLLASKTFWTKRLFPELRRTYTDIAQRDAKTPATPSEVGILLQNNILYQYFSWLERHLQRFKYSGRYGLVPYHAERREELSPKLQDTGAELSSSLKMPAYYQRIDIHQHPGGIGSDELDGFVYERGARSTTPLMGASHADLHQRFTDLVSVQGSAKNILDILDMGCGFGKSTHPFAQRFPSARIEAIDLSAPCLSLGARGAQNRGEDNINFRQMNAYETDYDDGSFDLVTSTMLIHEMPPSEIGRLFDEAVRLLKPGGRMAHLDFYAIDSLFARFIHYGHGRRNNEPFMQPLAELDMVEALRNRGFTKIEIIPFQEAEGINPGDHQAWRFPWTVIQAEKPVVG